MVLGLLNGCSENSRKHYGFWHICDNFCWLQENQDFPLLALIFVVLPRLACTMLKNIFKSFHVCSVLELDYISLSWWFFTVSSILKVWLLTILRRKLHCNCIAMTVLALKSKSHQILFFGFFNRSSMVLFTLRTWLQLEKITIYHYILLLGQGLHTHTSV